MSFHPESLPEYLATVSLAAAGLGTAAHGIVGNLKLVAWVDLAGFERLFPQGRGWPGARGRGLAAMLPALEAAYGPDALALLQGHYRSGRARGELPRLLRQGVRMGVPLLDEAAAVTLITAMGLSEARARALLPWLHRAGTIPPEAPPPGDLARLESIIDARIDGALAMAESQYGAQLRLCASVVALAIAWGVGAALHAAWWHRALVGGLAVPLAPVANDLAAALRQASQALRRR